MTVKCLLVKDDADICCCCFFFFVVVFFHLSFYKSVVITFLFSLSRYIIVIIIKILDKAKTYDSLCKTYDSLCVSGFSFEKIVMVGRFFFSFL